MTEENGSKNYLYIGNIIELNTTLLKVVFSQI